jgi:hypothetical protein
MSRRPTAAEEGDQRMYDALMLAIGCGFFVVAVFYVLACEKM